MTTHTPDALVLVGPMGAGKTSIGRRIAKSLDVPFYDSDAAVIRAHGPIGDIFRDHGEPTFRALERIAVRTGLQGGGVVSLGGGAVLDPETRADLAGHRVVLLTVAPEVVASRLRGDERPLLHGDHWMQTWTEIMAHRRPLYEEVADVVFDTSSGPFDDIAERIVAWARPGKEHS